MKVKLTVAQKIKVANSNSLYNIMREVLLRERLIDRSKEHFWVVCLAHNHKILLIELVSFGSATATIVEPTEVFSFALQKNAAKIIMVHNHPSGTLVPSFNDKDLTERMAAIGKFVKVPVLDHLIITEKNYFSFADTGLLKQIMEGSHYDLTFDQVDKLKWQMENAARMHAQKLKEKERSIEERDEKLKEKDSTIEKMAKKIKEKNQEMKEAVIQTSNEEKKVFAMYLLKEGQPVSKIVTLTGLSKKEVEKLKK